jgi:hypothetical protein
MRGYGTIDVTIWNDRKFRSLSSPPPCAQVLWLYLLAPRERILIPGLIPAGVATIAESLRWPLEATQAAFAEIEAQGMASFDPSGPLIWLPNALKFNTPNTNQVKGWGKAWAEVPECPLKRKAWGELRTSIHALGEAFAKAFDAAFPEPSDGRFAEPSPVTLPRNPSMKGSRKASRKASGKGSGNGSGEGWGEQNQKQDQEQKLARSAQAREGEASSDVSAGKPPELEPAPVVQPPNATEPSAVPVPPRGSREGGDDEPPRRPMLLVDDTELAPDAAEVRGRIEAGLGRRLLVATPGRETETRARFEAQVELLGPDLVVAVCLEVAKRLWDSKHEQVVSLAYFLPALEETKRLPGEGPEAQTMTPPALADFAPGERWDSVREAMTPSQRADFEAEKARIYSQVVEGRPWTSEQNVLLNEAEGFLFNKWSRRVAGQPRAAGGDA